VERCASLNAREALIGEVQRGLLRRPVHLRPEMFYHADGSCLFERITQLPEYHPTRVGRNILTSLTDRITAVASADESQSVRLLELGVGPASKTDAERPS
jgi:L-histidine Nalpha-methyltransferase